MDDVSTATNADPRPPSHARGAFDVKDLQRWFRETNGGHSFRMVGDNLRHRGIQDGDVLITDAGPLRYGCLAVRIFTDFNYENAAVLGAGEIVRHEDGEPALMIGGEAWGVDTEACSYVTPLLGWIPVREGEGILFEEAQLLALEGEAVAAPPEGCAAFLRHEAAEQAFLQL